MINVQITAALQSSPNDISIISTWLEKAADQSISYSKAHPNSDLTLLITDDKTMQELNLDYLGIDAPTDVLAFPAGDLDPDSQTVYLGDVVISYPRAVAQSQGAGHSLEDELALLVVHGVLHLLGYDHTAPGEKAAMWAVQAQILEKLGALNIVPPE